MLRTCRDIGGLDIVYLWFLASRDIRKWLESKEL
jgi:hypothetical protein